MRTITLSLLLLLLSTAEARKSPHPPPEEVAARNAALIRGVARKAGEPPWAHIVIHHTAVERGSLEGIDRYHRKRFDDPLGIEYHSLVGNGKKAPDGLIEIGRWAHRARSIHLFKPEGAPEGITISLMGNFEKRRPSEAQMKAVVSLTAHLMKLYDIPVERVTTHRRVDGRLTQCPGKLFPFDALVACLRGRPPHVVEPARCSGW